MRLRDFLDPSAVRLDLAAGSKDAALDELATLLGLDERATANLARLLRRREALGSTAVGRGIAIPHCRSLLATRLRLGFAQSRAGIEWDAVDRRPVHSIFLIVAPHVEVTSQYLPVLGRIAQFAQLPDVPERLKGLPTAEALFQLLDEKGA